MSFEEKVLSLLERINDKLDQLLNSGVPGKDKSMNTTYVATETMKPSEVVERQEAEEKAKGKPPVEGRRICPECGGTDFRTEEDKTQPPLHQMGGIKIYAKKYICKKCGKEI
jgi:DNA-directed RNA polymerase subunit M/transcription elongation factor TFIIS